MWNILFLLSVCIPLSSCAVLNQAQKVLQDVSHVSQATIEDMNNTTESTPRVLVTEFQLIGGTFPQADVSCRDAGTVFRTFTAQYIQDAVNRAGNCWTNNSQYPCKTSGSRSYPDRYNNGDNLTLAGAYCRNVYNDFMEEFPVKIDGTLYGKAPNTDDTHDLWRVIFQRTRIFGGSWNLRYCGIIRHIPNNRAHFELCPP
ncbi:hypothetical protein TWF694_005346 [Orbilia ellipsospora]|uniref:Uncharacterized protein n=1 Tax=Orbilia ellipsospora TaxID=2528407 RepID=A0AAV9WUE9_9PEZI